MHHQHYDYAADNLADLMGPPPASRIATSDDFERLLGAKSQGAATVPGLTPVKGTKIVQPTATLDLPEDAMFGWLKDKAKELDAPSGWAYCSLMTVYAGQGPNLLDYSSRVRPTLFTLLLGKPGDGKSTAMDRACGALMLPPGTIKRITPVSDRGLLKIFAPPKSKGKDSEPEPLRSYVLVSDEFRTIMQKMNIQGSSLPPTFCTLFYHDDVGMADKHGCVEVEVRLNVLGALVCDDPDDFRQQFGAETMRGLYSRLLIVPGVQGWKWDARWCPDREFRVPLTESTKVPSFCFDMVREWCERFPEVRGRLGEIALRVALITASANHDKEITREGMKAALRLAEWQERVRNIYSPSQAMTQSAMIAVAILDALKDHAAQQGHSWVRFRDLSRNRNWHRKWGSFVTQAKDSLIRDGLVEAEYEEDKDGEPIKHRPTGKIRLPITPEDEAL